MFHIGEGQHLQTDTMGNRDRAEADQIVERGRPAIDPMHYMVRVHPGTGPATGKKA